MGSRKSSGKKKRLISSAKKSSSVPAWVVVRTKRRVRVNPKRRMWRRKKLKV